MEEELRVAMLAYIDALDRRALIDEMFADQLSELARVAEADTASAGLSNAVIAMSRAHRVSAIKARANTAAMRAEYETRFGTGQVEGRR